MHYDDFSFLFSPSWKDEGECYRDPSYMKRYCPVACTDMKPVPRRNIECIDIHINCSFWAGDSECETNSSVKKYCPLSCGVGKCGNNSSNDKNKDAPNRGKREQKVLCTDDHELCSGWAVRTLSINFFLRCSVVDTGVIEIRRKNEFCFLHIRSRVDFLMLLVLSL